MAVQDLLDAAEASEAEQPPGQVRLQWYYRGSVAALTPAVLWTVPSDGDAPLAEVRAALAIKPPGQVRIEWHLLGEEQGILDAQAELEP